MYQFTELIVFFSMFFYYIGLLSFFFLWITSLQYVASLLINQKIKTTNFLICIKSSLSLLFFIALCNVYQFIPACFLLFSALTITIFTDLSAYLISRFVSLYLIPVGIALSFYHCTSISWQESIAMACINYVLFFSLNKIFFVLKKENGLGLGDIELFACIGSFIGIIGSWITLLLASTIGTSTIFCYMLYSGKIIRIIPFGIFLSIGAMLYIIIQPWIFSYLCRL